MAETQSINELKQESQFKKINDKFKKINGKVQYSYEKIRKKSTNLWDDIVNAISKNTYYYSLFQLVILGILLIIVYIINPFNISEIYSAQLIIFFLLVVFVMIMGASYVQWKYPNKENTPNNDSSTDGKISKYPLLKFIIRIGILILGLMGLCYWLYLVALMLFTIINYTPNLVSLSGHISSIIAVLVALAALYTLVKPYLNYSNRYLKLLEDITFYLPCLIIDLVTFIKNEWKITTPSIWIILGIEILVILLYIAIPYIYNSLSISSGTQILRDPIYTSHATKLGDFQGVSFDDILDKKIKKDGYFDYAYSYSAWFRLNPQPPNVRLTYNKFTNIITYGNKPRIEYNGLYNKLRVRTDLGNGEQLLIYQTNEIPYQRWNNIVVNFDGGTMDVFLNGKLVSSRPNVAPCLTHDIVEVGENRGIEGGVANVVYYDYSRSKKDIETTYKLLSNRNPPFI